MKNDNIVVNPGSQTNTSSSDLIVKEKKRAGNRVHTLVRAMCDQNMSDTPQMVVEEKKER